MPAWRVRFELSSCVCCPKPCKGHSVTVKTLQHQKGCCKFEQKKTPTLGRHSPRDHITSSTYQKGDKYRPKSHNIVGKHIQLRNVAGFLSGDRLGMDCSCACLGKLHGPTPDPEIVTSSRWACESRVPVPVDATRCEGGGRTSCHLLALASMVVASPIYLHHTGTVQCKRGGGVRVHETVFRF